MERDQGSGVVWVLVVMALVATVALTATAIGGAVVTRHRASSAADFAALAAADALARASADPCAAAQLVAERYGATVASCVTNGMEVEVAVEIVLGGLVGPSRAAVVRARAGPS